MYQGDTRNIIVPITRDDNSELDLTGCTIKWGLRPKEYNSDNIIFKETPNVLIYSNVLTIKLLPEDTINLHGTYYHECKMIDAQGDVSTLFVGKALIIDSNV